MLNKILTVTTLILLIWLSNESLKTKKINASLETQLQLVQKQLITLKNKNIKANKKTHLLLSQVLQQQKATIKKLSSNKKQTFKKKKTHKKKPKKKAPKKDLHSSLMQSLSDIDKAIKNKKLPDASKELSALKKLLWSERNNKKTSKDKILSILSSIDALQKKLKTNSSDAVYSTKSIKEKIIGLNLKGESKNEK